MEPPAVPPEHAALPDLTGSSLFDLLRSRDPVLAASLQRLIEVSRASSDVQLGWGSMIDLD
jgi:hypothetical protein